MTMVTLRVNPTTTACTLTPLTISLPFPVSTEPSESIPTTCTTRNKLSLQHAALRDSPTTVPTTAAPSGAADDDQPFSSVLSKNDDIDERTTLLQEWNIFYSEYVQSKGNCRDDSPLPPTCVIDAVDDDDTIQLQYILQPSAPDAQPTTLHQPCPSSPDLIQAMQTTDPTSPTLLPQPISQCNGPMVALMAVGSVGTDDDNCS